jgi:hypothetical protein
LVLRVSDSSPASRRQWAEADALTVRAKRSTRIRVTHGPHIRSAKDESGHPRLAGWPLPMYVVALDSWDAT